MSETTETTLNFKALPARLLIAGGVLIVICVAAGLADKR